MRVLTWTLVTVLAVGAIGCAQKKDEELPAIDPAELEATASSPEPMPAVTSTPAVEVETPAAEVKTPAPTPPLTTAKPIGGGTTYTMQKGDTLYSLARRFYGDGKLWTKIADANKGTIRDVTSIPVGTVLTIPPK